MSVLPADEYRRLRKSVYAILIALSAGSMLGRIMAVSSVDVLSAERQLKREGKTDWQRTRPFLSANDRSRWLTVRALVEHGTYALDDVIQERGWDSIDIVKHKGTDGQEHLYSSKPPLLATILAGPYWLVHKATGRTLGTHPFEIGRPLVVLFNVLPLLVYFGFIVKLAERVGLRNWSRIFAVAAACFGTFLTTFAVCINNHIPAAACAAVTLFLSIRIWYDGERRWWYFAVCGLFAALIVACELPGLALFAAITAALLWRAPRETLLAYLPAAVVVAAASFGTNYLAHGTLRPAYAFRSKTDPAENWYDFDYIRNGKVQQSYWRQPGGIDRGEPSRAVYALHTLVGHHGIFSLTPIWLLSMFGVVLLWRDRRLGGLALVIAAVSIACYAFYLARPQMDRNYGGMTSGLRWMFWLAPLWLTALLPAADRLARWRAGRAFCLVLLALSVMSASYPTWNPWTHPWLTNLMLHLGWIDF